MGALMLDTLTARGKTFFPVARIALSDPRDVAELSRRFDPASAGRLRSGPPPALLPDFPLRQGGPRLPTDEEMERCLRSLRKAPARYSSFGTNSWPELFYQSRAAFTAVANVATETSLMSGPNLQPTISPPTFAAVPAAWARGLSFRGWELMGTTTGPPTLTFKFYLNTTQGASSLAGTNVGITAAITTVASVTNKLWKFELDLVCQTPGQGSNNATLFASGFIEAVSGFASPFRYYFTPGTGESATVTATLDGSLTQYFNMSATWSAASASNTITMNMLQAFGWN